MKPWHLIVVVLVFLLFFGIPKLPELARSLGRSLRIFKSETKDLLSDDSKPDVSSKADAASRAQLKDQPETPEPLAGDIVDPPRREKSL